MFTALDIIVNIAIFLFGSSLIITVPAIVLILLLFAATVNNNFGPQFVFAQQQNETCFLTYDNPAAVYLV